MEAVCRGRGSGSLGRRCSYDVDHELALILPRFPLHPSHDFRRDRPRSDHDRASIVLQILKQMLIDDHGIDSTRKDPRSRRDRAAITVRSNHDRGVLPRVAYAVGLESDAPEIFTKREENRTSRGH